jgi:hypothetical protein
MDVTGVVWRTSSYTGSGGGNCVEVASQPQDNRILIRDTKDRHGPVLAFSPGAWRTFTTKATLQSLHVQSAAHAKALLIQSAQMGPLSLRCYLRSCRTCEASVTPLPPINRFT